MMRNASHALRLILSMGALALLGGCVASSSARNPVAVARMEPLIAESYPNFSAKPLTICMLSAAKPAEIAALAAEPEVDKGTAFEAMRAIAARPRAIACVVRAAELEG